MPRTARELTKQDIITLAKAGEPVERFDGEVVGLRLRVYGKDSVFWRWGGTIRGRFVKPEKIGMAYAPSWTPNQVKAAQDRARETAAKWLIGLERGVTPQETKAEEEKAEQARKDSARLEEEKRPPPLRDYIADVYADFVRHANKDAEATINRISKNFFDWEVPARARGGNPLHLGDWPITEIRQAVADEWKVASLKKGKSAATVKRDLGALRAALSPTQCSAVEKWLTDAPFRVRGLKVLDEHPRYLMRGSRGEDNEYERLMAALDARQAKLREARTRNNERRIARGIEPYPELDGVFADEWKPFITLLLLTGLRCGEATALQWRDVDFVGRRITVRAANAKGEKTRVVPMNDQLLETLKGWRKQTKGLGHVFTQSSGKHKGKPIGETKTLWKRILKEARIEDFRVHDLRHTFASWLVQEGVDLYQVKDLLGHSTVKITERYAHLSPDHGRAAVERLTA